MSLYSHEGEDRNLESVNNAAKPPTRASSERIQFRVKVCAMGHIATQSEAACLEAELALSSPAWIPDPEKGKKVNNLPRAFGVPGQDGVLSTNVISLKPGTNCAAQE